MSIGEQELHLSQVREEDYLSLSLWISHIYEKFSSRTSPSKVKVKIMKECPPSLSDYAKQIKP